MKIKIYDKNGISTSELSLDKTVFGIEPNLKLLAQYIFIYRTNQRQGTVSTKTRSEVSGGGKKPWRQKGTGRARAGSTRSPIWVHGGVAHGPNPKSYSLSFPKKMRKAAMLSALSLRYQEGIIKVLDFLSIQKYSTKEVSIMMDKLGLQGKTLIILDENNEVFLKSCNNLKNLQTVRYDNLNAYQVMEAKNLLFIKNAVVKLQEKMV